MPGYQVFDRVGTGEIFGVCRSQGASRTSASASLSSAVGGR
jgi:hypothetical protein